MRQTAIDLDQEAADITSLLRRKTVSLVRRHQAGEVMIEFADGSRLFVNSAAGSLEFSITDGRST